MSTTGDYGERIALYLDESMTNGETWNPVAASEMGGFYELGGVYLLPASLTYSEALAEVDRLNQAVLGLDKGQAFEIVAASFRNNGSLTKGVEETLKFEITLKIEVDWDAYEETFGMNESREEIREYVTDQVVESANGLSIFSAERLAKITGVRTQGV